MNQKPEKKPIIKDFASVKEVLKKDPITGFQQRHGNKTDKEFIAWLNR